MLFAVIRIDHLNEPITKGSAVSYHLDHENAVKAAKQLWKTAPAANPPRYFVVRAESDEVFADP